MFVRTWILLLSVVAVETAMVGTCNAVESDVAAILVKLARMEEQIKARFDAIDVRFTNLDSRNDVRVTNLDSHSDLRYTNINNNLENHLSSHRTALYVLVGAFVAPLWAVFFAGARYLWRRTPLPAGSPDLSIPTANLDT